MADTKNATGTAAKTVRSSGLLMHVTSLPSKYGIGDLGPAAFNWVDTLARAKQLWWQILPLNAPDSSNSPYSAHSAFGGNAFLISPELLVRDGLLTRRQLPEPTRDGPVQFTKVRAARREIYTAAFARFRAGAAKSLQREYETFCEDEAAWLEDFALFIALKERTPGVIWTDWPRELVRREPAALREARQSLADQIERQKFLQFIFWRQLDALRAYAAKRGVQMMGDVPIYVSPDSADVWSHPHLFQLDRDRRPKSVAGVPPDLFSATGQRWGNPLFDWKAMQAEGFKWWIARLKAALRQADVIRIDHFRGLAGYWSIPSSAPTAETGRWIKAPGAEMLDAVQMALGDLPLVAEDLGVITPDVVALRDRYGMAGMQIIQFAFGGDDNVALPHNHPRNTIAYTGNHDNDTTVGWWKTLPRDQRERVNRYAPEVQDDPAWGMIRLAMMSVADRAIFPLQDILELGTAARMNMPGSTSKQTWAWRATEAQMKSDGFDRLAEMTTTYFREPPARRSGKR